MGSARTGSNPVHSELVSVNFFASLDSMYWNFESEIEIIVVPHSHNDPGWLRTFEGYYHLQTSKVLNYMVEKMTVLKNMTFVWSEISFLALWWERRVAVGLCGGSGYIYTGYRRRSDKRRLIEKPSEQINSGDPTYFN
ncbi:alpha-mannosidase 2x-like [Aphis craccivora]|uniref:Alpha-mannosidase 2x-like n=1 Tax=Aphis craccivora TaxID=307492 RepID=A0A6G0Z180_APHCR|nr:alpha-mannosidase 2x-like [Aphis craccivora]